MDKTASTRPREDSACLRDATISNEVKGGQSRGAPEEGDAGLGRKARRVLLMLHDELDAPLTTEASHRRSKGVRVRILVPRVLPVLNDHGKTQGRRGQGCPSAEEDAVVDLEVRQHVDAVLHKFQILEARRAEKGTIESREIVRDDECLERPQARKDLDKPPAIRLVM